METPSESDMSGRKTQEDIPGRNGEEDRYRQKISQNEQAFKILKKDLHCFKQKEQNPTTSQIQKMWKNINRACSENIN